jgi:hypothetical protein
VRRLDVASSLVSTGMVVWTSQQVEEMFYRPSSLGVVRLVLLFIEYSLEALFSTGAVDLRGNCEDLAIG